MHKKFFVNNVRTSFWFPNKTILSIIVLVMKYLIYAVKFYESELFDNNFRRHFIQKLPGIEARSQQFL